MSLTQIANSWMRKNVLYLFDLDLYDTEQSRFLKYYVSNSIKTIRWGLVLATLLYAVFGILDIYMAPQTYYQIWIVRFVFVIPVFVVGFVISFSKFFVRCSQPIMMLVFLIANLGIIFMIAISQPSEPAYRFYYAGIILVVIGHHTVIKMTNQLSLILSIIIILCYDALAIYFQKLANADDLSILINNNFFLVSSAVLGDFAAKTNERLFKRDFLQKQKLAESNAKLDELNSVKSKLLSIIAHDLRGPLTSTKSMLDLLAKGFITECEFKKNVCKLSTSVNSASILLENLLSWSVFHLHGRAIVKEKVSLKRVTENVFGLLQVHAEKKSVQLINSIQDDMIVSAQPTLIEAVIRNLVSNAIKFTEHGKVEVNSVVRDSTICVSIEDTGSGMPQEVASDLFDWTKKKSLPGTQMERGTGIGLLICKEFIEKHDGSIFFNSEVGKGTTFSFTLGQN